MKKSILEHLYQGTMVPCEKYQTILNQYSDKKDRVYNGYEALLNKLPHPLQEELEQVIDSHYSLLPIEYEQTFIDGFKLGVKMMMEIFDEPKE